MNKKRGIYISIGIIISFLIVFLCLNLNEFKNDEKDNKKLSNNEGVLNTSEELYVWKRYTAVDYSRKWRTIWEGNHINTNTTTKNLPDFMYELIREYDDPNYVDVNDDGIPKETIWMESFREFDPDYYHGALNAYITIGGWVSLKDEKCTYIGWKLYDYTATEFLKSGFCGDTDLVYFRTDIPMNNTDKPQYIMEAYTKRGLVMVYKRGGYGKGNLVNIFAGGKNAYIHNQKNPDGYFYVREKSTVPQPTYLSYPTNVSAGNDIKITWNRFYGSGISFSWKNMTYTLEKSNDGINFTPIATNISEYTTTYTDKASTNASNKNYWYRIKYNFDIYGDNNDTFPVSGGYFTGAKGTINHYTSPSISGSINYSTSSESIGNNKNITWTAANFNSGGSLNKYELYYSKNGGNTWDLIATPTINSWSGHVLGDVTNQAKYRVRACKTNTNNVLDCTSNYLTGGEFIVKNNKVAPPTPVIIESSNGDDWLSVSNGSIKVKTDDGALIKMIGGSVWSNTNEITYTGLTPGKEYSFVAYYPETSTHFASPESLPVKKLIDKLNHPKPSEINLDIGSSSIKTNISDSKVNSPGYIKISGDNTWKNNGFSFNNLIPNTKYSFYAKYGSSSTHNESEEYVGDEVYTLAQIPKLSILNGTKSELNIVIGNEGNPDYTKYKVEKSLDESTGFTLFKDYGTNRNLTDNNLIAGTNYFYRVKAINEEGKETDWSKVYRFITVPNDITEVPLISDIKQNEFKVSWEPVKGAANYKIYLNGNLVKTVGDVSNTVLTGLIPNKKYYAEVAAGNETGYSEKSPKSIDRYTLAENPLSISLLELSDSIVKFKINEGNNETETNYKVSIVKKGDSCITSNFIDTKDWGNYGVSNVVFNNLESNTAYEFCINTRNESKVENGEVKYLMSGSNYVNGFYTHAKTPLLSITDIKEKSIGLKINDNGNNSNVTYYIERLTNVMVKNWSVEKDVIDSGLQPATKYSYRVKAKNSNGVETLWSEIISATTKPAVVTNLVLSVGEYNYSLNTTSMKLNWGSVLGAKSYNIYRDDKLIFTTDSTNTSYIDGGLDWNKSYTYNVSAVNDGGEGLLSNKVSKYTRARNIEGVEFTNLTDKELIFDVIENNLNKEKPSYKFEVRKSIDGSRANNPVDISSKNTKNRKLNGLSLGVSYELWVIVTNEDGLSNNEVKLLDEFWMNRPPSLNMYLEDNHTKKYKEYNVGVNDTRIDKSGYVPKDKFAVYSDENGYNSIRVRGEVKDPDTIPSLEPLKIKYTIRNNDGSTVPGHTNIEVASQGEVVGASDGGWHELKYNNNIGKFTGISHPRYDSSLDAYSGKPYKYNDYIDIAVDNKLTDGKYTIDVTLSDGQGEYVTETAKFIIDRTKGSGKLVKKGYDKYYGIDLEIQDVNLDFAGSDKNPYLIEVSKNNTNIFNTLFDYSNNISHTHSLNSKTQSNTKYTYRALLKDKAGNIYTSNDIEYISAVDLKPAPYTDDKGNKVYYSTDKPNDIEMSWENTLNKLDGLYIEIYRNGILIDKVNEGDKYIDSNLDYDKEYKYEFIVVGSDLRGNRLESLKVDFVSKTGSPVLIVDGNDKIYKTLFSKYAKANFNVEFNQGGSVFVEYEDLKGKFNKTFNLIPKIRNPLEFELSADKLQVIPFTFRLEGNNVQKTVTKSVTVEEVIPVVKDIKGEDYIKKYSTDK